MSEADSNRTWFSAPGFVTGLVTDGQWHDLDNGDIAPRTAIGISLDRRYFYIVVCAADYASGYRLRLTVASEDGQRASTEFVDFTGPGTYSFNMLDSSDPTICASGYVFGYKVELVDSDGAKVPRRVVGGRGVWTRPGERRRLCVFD